MTVHTANETVGAGDSDGDTVSGLRSHLSYLLSEAERAVNQGLGERLVPDGVSVEQWRILLALSEGRGRSMGDLARAALMPHPTLTKAVDRLVDSALVYRRQSEGDRRRVAVHLSDRGRELICRLHRRTTQHHTELMEAYGTERTLRLMRELEQLVASLR